MTYILENDDIRITLGKQGGELYGIKGKKEDIEYLWNGRPYGWPLSAPTLFPTIGKVKNEEYKINGKHYKMHQHGFASRRTHEIIEKNDNSIIFELKYDDKSLEIFPFKFVLRTKYEIKQNIINIKYNVINLDTKPIIFTLGSHPCFMCPLNKEELLEDYYLEFEKIQDEVTILNITEDDFLTGTEEVYLKDTNKFYLSKDTFKRGTLIFNNLNSNKVSLKSKSHNKYVTVEFSDFRYLSMWATENTRPFVCIEPWLGHADYDNFNGEFKDKEGNIILDVGKEFSCQYNIIINE